MINEPALELPTDGSTASSSTVNLWTALRGRLGKASEIRIRRYVHGKNIPLSCGQQQLWVINQRDPESPAYNLNLAWQLSGPLQFRALEQSLNTIVQRHETLRTAVLQHAGEAVQTIVAVEPFKLGLVDLQGVAEEKREAHARQWMERETRRPFDLSRPPLLRAVLLRVTPESHFLLLVVHHISFDGFSIGILSRELESLYVAFVQGQAPSLPELPIRYADYALWEREYQRSERYQAQLEYWKKHLGGKLPVLDLPTDYPRGAGNGSPGAGYAFDLPNDLSAGLLVLRKEEQATTFQVLLAAFEALLHRYTGQEDMIVGFPSAHRGMTEVQGLIGYFVNTQAVRVPVHADLSFRELLSRVKIGSLDALTNQDVPFYELVQMLKCERDTGTSPIFQVMFSLQRAASRAMSFPGLSVRDVEIHTGAAMFDLILDILESPQGLTGYFEYRTDLFRDATIRRMAQHFTTLLAGAISRPDTKLRQLPLMSPEERHQILVEWNATAKSLPIDFAYPGFFEEQVGRTPLAPALRFKGMQWSYAELNCRANQLAHYLRRLGVGPGVLVGVCVQRSPSFAVSVLAILKAGGAYLPLDRSSPPHHLAQILADARPAVVVTESQYVSSLGLSKARLVCLDDPQTMTEVAKCPESDFENNARGENLAYVLYTSGSTGQPKGVQITNRSLLNHNLAIGQAFQLHSADRVLQFSSLSFDISVEELFPTWLAGACLVFRREEDLRSLDDFLELIRKERLTVLDLPTAFWHELVDFLKVHSLPPSVRLVVIGGEKASEEKYRLWKQTVSSSVGLINTYGPTETTVTATFFVGGSGNCEDLPIGRPMANVQVYVLDKYLQPVPIGVPGELHIGGAGVARGYHNRPELTAEKFIPDPFSTAPGARLYKTGDLVRWRADGNLEFLGRIDQQVKVRGFRIEFGEIESALLQHPQVAEAVVSVTDSTTDKRLVAYYVAKGSPPAVAALRQFLKEKLPAYMVPGAFVALDKLPVTPHGKVDRKALPAPPEQRQLADLVLPRTPTEEKLAQIWCEVLGLKQVGIHDNYFDLGGHSLKAVWLFQKVKQVFGKNLPMVTLFQAPTVAQLAEVVQQEDKSASWSSLVPIKATGTRPPFFCIHGVGGNILEFLDLAKYMDEEQPFYGLQAVGLDGKRPWLQTVEEMAAHYIQEIRGLQPRGPYHLGGSSFGGLVAYEIAQQLRAQGEEVGLLVFFDTWAPGYPKALPSTSWFRKRLHYWQYRLHLHWSNLMLLPTGKERWAYICTKARKWQRGKLMQWTQLKERWRERGAHWFLPAELRKIRQSGNRAADMYVPSPYQGKVTLFRAMEQFKGIVPEPLRGWDELVKGGIEAFDIPGHHGAIMREPRVKILAACFKECLSAAHEAGGSCGAAESVASSSP